MRQHRCRHAWSVTGKGPRPTASSSLVLAHPDGARLPDWTPGAHIDLMLPNGEHPAVLAVRRPLGRVHATGSACCASRRARWLGLRARRLQAGDPVGVGGPRNNFALVPSARYLFIAGGIGITPLLPMVHQADLLGADWDLVYGGRRRAVDGLPRRAGRLRRPGARLPEDEDGLLDLPAWLGEAAPGHRRLLLRPRPAARRRRARAARGWPPHALRTERFAAKEQGARSGTPRSRCELRPQRHAVTVTPDVTVLDAVRAAGARRAVVLPSRAPAAPARPTSLGRRARTTATPSSATHERAAGDCMFLCVSRSCTDRLVLDL